VFPYQVIMVGRINIGVGLFALALSIPVGLPAQSPVEGAEVVTLQPGDRVNVEIWRENELSGSFLVDENGMITLPLLGDVEVIDIPIDRLRSFLRDEYRVHLVNPSINIVPLRKILVLGHVRNPGPYEVHPTESVLGVIAQAGGPTSAGNIRRVQVIRGGDVVMDGVQVESTLARLGLRSEDLIVVQPRNWFARNQTFVISVLLALPSAIFTITRIVD
jgi:protein involved in polysaccharide export with SLBB domain